MIYNSSINSQLSMSNFKVGKLKFKEGAKPTYISKKARKQEEKEEGQEEDIVVGEQLINYEPQPGQGTITTSGRTIHGNDTNFRTDLERGDSIIIQNPVFKTREERGVILVLSSKSLLLEEPFLQEYSSFVSYMIKKKTKVIPGANITKEYKQKLEEIAKTKMIKKDEMSVRLKKGMWGYETKKVDVDLNLSREEQLNVREKMIKDKHCW